METQSIQNILTIDIGGSHVKATILNRDGALTMEYQKLDTPKPSTPQNLPNTIKSLIRDFPPFDCVLCSLAFPVM